MDDLIMNINWLALIIGTIVSFAFGWLWYSPKMFGIKWAEWNWVKLDSDCKHKAMLCTMVYQFIVTFLLAMIIAVAMRDGTIMNMILTIMTMLFLIISNGKWANKNIYIIAIDVWFILAMSIIMVVAQVMI